MVKKILLLSISLSLLTFTLLAQEDYSREKDDKYSNDKSFSQKLNWGGGAGMQFGAKTYIEISPKVSYPITEKLYVGGGITYIYYKFDWDKLIGYGGVSKSSVYGGSLFTQDMIYNNIFTHIEYEALSFEYYDVTISDYNRQWVGSFFVGGGFRQAFGKNGYLQLMLLYNLNHQALSPYSSPWVPRISIFF
ncbi:MAG: hypothetical protein U9R42_00820 [Bacteroidota bacterium]|nr:hypothetical protein [Bacteroidota bacterium]